ncbi:amidohydrolase family protein, partial [Roseateles sp.]|uniref:amidohydrolase family protein n=1 Tax=Roseateles sp. TaxID=1971397 RepID=UPI003BA774DF
MSVQTFIEHGTVIAWRGGRQEVLRDALVVFAGQTIEYVGPEDGRPREEGSVRIDARGRLVIPGLVNTHLHATDTLFTKGYLEEASNLS